MLEVGLPALAQEGLHAQREQAFQGCEDQAQHQQLEHEVVEAGRECAPAAKIERLRLGSAHQERRDTEYDAEQAAALGARERDAEGPERERRNDARLKDAAKQPNMGWYIGGASFVTSRPGNRKQSSASTHSMPSSPDASPARLPTPM